MRKSIWQIPIPFMIKKKPHKLEINRIKAKYYKPTANMLSGVSWWLSREESSC